MELHGFLHVLKKVGEGGFAVLTHFVRLLADNHKNLVGQGVSDNLHLQREILLFNGLQRVGEELEGEGCGLFVESAVVQNPLRRRSDERGGGDKQHDNG